MPHHRRHARAATDAVGPQAASLEPALRLVEALCPGALGAVRLNDRWTILSGEALDPGIEADLEVLARGDGATGAPRWRLRDDGGFVAATPIKDAHGTTAGWLAALGSEPLSPDPATLDHLSDIARLIGVDLTPRSRAQAAPPPTQSAASILRFASILRAMPFSVVVTNESYEVIGSSPKWADGVDRRPDEIVGRHISELAPREFERWREIFDRAMAGETFAMERFRHRRPRDNAVRWSDVEIAPWRDDDGGIGGVVITTHDVTSMVEALEGGARSEQRLNLALEIADLHVWEMDLRTRRLVKAGAEDTIFDCPQTYDDLEADLFGAVDPRDRPAVEEAWREHLETGAPYRPEYRVLRADHREVWASMASRLVHDDKGRPVRLVSAMRNVTERKAAEQALLTAKEEAELASRSKTAFLATMSHEIRTPLNGVLGMAQAMAADPLDPTQRERLEIVRRSGETLLTILNNILDLSKIEAGKLELEDTDFDIAALLETARGAFAEVAAQKGLKLSTHIEPSARGVYRADSTRLLQILHNLVSNGLKFTEEGGVAISVAREGGHIRLEVSDTGIGMPLDSLERLFEKFEQADASTTRRHGGTGLGLAICRELAVAMGGAIEVRSAPDAGAIFTVRLPLQRISEETILEAAAAAEAAVEPDRVLRVLAAEDNNVNQLVLKTLLNQAGIDPFIVSDGQEALEAWREREWDVVLMDVQMPNLDGPSASRRIRELEIRLGRRRTPIIALTANAMSHQIPEYVAAGMDGFIPKPISVPQLFRALELALADGEAEVGYEDADAA